MEGYAKLKVPGGKLLATRIVFSDKIERIEITGDFFVYPETGLWSIEKALTGLQAKSAEVDIVNLVKKVVESNGITLVGIDPESLAKAMIMAMKNGVAGT